MPGWVYAHVWEATSAQVSTRVMDLRLAVQTLDDALCCETICTTGDVLSCGSSNTASHPLLLFLFLWRTEKWVDISSRSQEHSYVFPWLSQRPWKASNEGYTEAEHFTKISGIPVSAMIWASSTHCRLSTLLRQYYHGFVCATTVFQSRWWMKLFSRVQKWMKESLMKIWGTFSQDNMNIVNLVGKCHNPGLLKTK